MPNFGEDMMEGGDRIYLDLRSGWLGETKTIRLDDSGLPMKAEYEPYVSQGYQLGFNERQDGTRVYYVSRKRRSIEGFVTRLAWYRNELPSKAVLTGWKVTVETPDKIFVIQVDSNDRVFSQLMNSLLNVDFNETIKFTAYKKEGKKNLLMYQADNEGKDFIRGLYPMRFLSNMIKNKIKENVPLDERDKANVAYNPDGSFNPNYPYITQNMQDKWSSDVWNDFLMVKMNEEVIPAIADANDNRGSDWKHRYSSHVDDMVAPSEDWHSGPDDFAPSHEEVKPRATEEAIAATAPGVVEFSAGEHSSPGGIKIPQGVVIEGVEVSRPASSPSVPEVVDASIAKVVETPKKGPAYDSDIPF